MVIVFLLTVNSSVIGVNCFVDSSNWPIMRCCPASINNYRRESRTTNEIEYIVIHTVQGSMQGAIHTFCSHDLDNPRSAHFTIGMSGDVAKSVDPKYIAWHTGTSPLGSGGKYESKVLNSNSIGIEHGGFVDDPEFPTQDQYLTSAALTRYLCEKYRIPIDREHIVGHEEIKSAKGDPGSNWDWNYYMNLVKDGSRILPDELKPSPKVLPETRPALGLLPIGLVLAGLVLSIGGLVSN